MIPQTGMPVASRIGSSFPGARYRGPVHQLLRGPDLGFCCTFHSISCCSPRASLQNTSSCVVFGLDPCRRAQLAAISVPSCPQGDQSTFPHRFRATLGCPSVNRLLRKGPLLCSGCPLSQPLDGFVACSRRAGGPLKQFPLPPFVPSPDRAFALSLQAAPGFPGLSLPPLPSSLLLPVHPLWASSGPRAGSSPPSGPAVQPWVCSLEKVDGEGGGADRSWGHAAGLGAAGLLRTPQRSARHQPPRSRGLPAPPRPSLPLHSRRCRPRCSHRCWTWARGDSRDRGAHGWGAPLCGLGGPGAVDQSAHRWPPVTPVYHPTATASFREEPSPTRVFRKTT